MSDTPESVRNWINPKNTVASNLALERYAELLKQHDALKARVTFLKGTVKSILDHVNRGNAPERYAGMTDFGISQDRGMTLSFIKSLAKEALR